LPFSEFIELPRGGGFIKELGGKGPYGIPTRIWLHGSSTSRHPATHERPILTGRFKLFLPRKSNE
jgi:hypothetical protein